MLRGQPSRRFIPGALPILLAITKWTSLHIYQLSLHTSFVVQSAASLPTSISRPKANKLTTSAQAACPP